MQKEHKLNESIMEDFRTTFYNGKLIDKLSKSGSWDQICAAMDSIEVGVAMINTINENKRHHHFAIELIELFTAGQMIKEGVFRMHKALFNDDYELKNDNSVLKIENMPDDKAFSEYRGLSFAHSVEFRASNKMAKGQLSSFSWPSWTCHSGKEKIASTIKYPEGEQVQINFNDIFNYVKKRYEYLVIIKEKIINNFKYAHFELY